MLTDIDKAEIRGLFFGEGSLDLHPATRGRRSYIPRARMGLRADDLPTLTWLQGHLGGCLYKNNIGRTNPVWVWQLVGVRGVSALLDILEGGSIPSKKRPEVALLREAIALIPVRGAHLTDTRAQRLTALRNALVEGRAYREAASG